VPALGARDRRGVRHPLHRRRALTRVCELATPHGVDAAELHRRTAGNPFFVTEALAAVASILGKLGARTRGEAGAQALRDGLVTGDVRAT
jgi:hypothetical protein